MNYKMTFEEGSEALAHCGLLGMRWGIRNNTDFESAKAFVKSYKLMPEIWIVY